MKNLGKLCVFTIVALALVFNSCKKEPKDLENSYMDLVYVSGNGLWICDNTLRYVANLSPNSITGAKVSITYTSNADPVGFTIEASYYNTTLDWGRDVYNIQKIDRDFKAAVFTNAEKQYLKVNPAGDEVKIVIGDNLLTKTVSFEKKSDKLIVANVGIRGSGLWSGTLRYYNEDGARPEIKVYSQSHPTPITINPDTNLGDNGYRASNVETDEAFGHTVYSIKLVDDHEANPSVANGIFVNNDSDVFYVELDGKKYSYTYSNERIYNGIMTIVN